MDIVAYSGGFDSTFCLIKALGESKDVTAIFFDYGQPYLKQEMDVVKIIKNRGVNVEIVKIDNIECKNGVFKDRNKILLNYIVKRNPRRIWFGTRNLFPFMDKYKDSNWWFAKKLSSVSGIEIKTPCVMLPKAYIKKMCRNYSVFSSEGFVYD